MSSAFGISIIFINFTNFNRSRFLPWLRVIDEPLTCYQFYINLNLVTPPIISAASTPRILSGKGKNEQ